MCENYELLGNVDPDRNFYSDILDKDKQSLYYSVDEINNDDSNLLSVILSCNIRSLAKNCDSFLAMLYYLKVNPFVISLSETWLKNENKILFNIHGYKNFHTIRQNRISGGVSVMVREDLVCEHILTLSVANEFMESCVVKIELGGDEMFIFSVYRSHHQDIPSFTDNLLILLNDPILLNRKIILTGDFNVNLLDTTNSHVNYFVHSMQSLNFLSTILHPTRLSDSQISSLLDHLWVNFCSTFKVVSF